MKIVYVCTLHFDYCFVVCVLFFVMIWFCIVCRCQFHIPYAESRTITAKYSPSSSACLCCFGTLPLFVLQIASVSELIVIIADNKRPRSKWTWNRNNIGTRFKKCERHNIQRKLYHVKKIDWQSLTMNINTAFYCKMQSNNNSRDSNKKKSKT